MDSDFKDSSLLTNFTDSEQSQRVTFIVVHAFWFIKTSLLGQIKECRYIKFY